jgi:AP-3 complex subunit beta
VLPVGSTRPKLSIRFHRRLDQTHLPSLLPIITTLLRDRSPLSIGSASLAFQAVCPTRLDLLHPQYRRLCRILVDVDEWGQVELMELLLRYARSMLTRPVGGGDGGIEEADMDLQLLLSSAEPLFQSRNPAVSLFHPELQKMSKLKHTIRLSWQ